MTTENNQPGNASKDSDNTSQSSDAGGHKWNFHQASADAARHIIAHLVESIYARTDLSQEDKAKMLEHLNGLDHVAMAKVIDSHYSNK